MNFVEVLAVISDFLNVFIWSAVFILLIAAGIKKIITGEMLAEEKEQEDKRDNENE